MTTEALLPERPENFAEAIDSITPEICDALRNAVETGRWPDGRSLTQEQRAQSLQAVIAWEALNLPPEQRVGHMEDQCKTAPVTGSADTIITDRVPSK